MVRVESPAMSIASCPHADHAAPLRACAHLIAQHDGDFLRCFTGVGTVCHLVCQACVDAGNDATWELAPLCAWCFADIEKEGSWVGIRGSPAIQEQPSRLLFSSRTIPVGGLPAAISVIHGVSDQAGHSWVALCRDGSLVALDLANARHRVITNLSGGLMDLTAESAIAVCPDGRYASVVEVHGQHGVVIDLTTGRQCMVLVRDDYHNRHCHFPISFARHAGRTVLIHATAWNRLDVSDPATGVLLSTREHEPVRKDEQPEHYLDYFHGRLLVSPDQRWIVDDGWVWSPVGILSAWRLDRWLDENVWESEDGPSRLDGPVIPYFWGGQFCWVGDDQVAVWGYGDDDEWMIPAVRILAVSRGDLRREVRWFPGPEVASLVDGNRVLEPNPPAWQRMWYDRYLFAFSPRSGVGVWDVATGARVLHSEWFSPDAYHRGTREFASIVPAGVRLTRLVGG